jgi:hypothetical protein
MNRDVWELQEREKSGVVIERKWRLIHPKECSFDRLVGIRIQEEVSKILNGFGYGPNPPGSPIVDTDMPEPNDLEPILQVVDAITILYP